MHRLYAPPKIEPRLWVDFAPQPGGQVLVSCPARGAEALLDAAEARDYWQHLRHHFYTTCPR